MHNQTEENNTPTSAVTTTTIETEPKNSTSEVVNPPELAKYQCKKCLNDGIEPVSVSFETPALLMEHYQVAHVANDEHNEAAEYERLAKKFENDEKSKMILSTHQPSIEEKKPETITTHQDNNNTPQTVNQNENKIPEQTPITTLTVQKRKSRTESVTETPKTTTSTSRKKPRVSLKADVKLEQETKDEEHKIETKKNETKLNEITTEDSLKTKIENINPDELIHFNLTMTQVPEFKSKYDHVINEENLLKRFAYFNTTLESLNKDDRLIKEKYVWATWRYKNTNYKWPSIILRRVPKSRSQVMVKYYENGITGQYSFKMKINELFSLFTQDHFKFKQQALELEEHRFNFMVSYTQCLYDFENMLNQEEKSPKKVTVSKQGEQVEETKHRIGNKEFTLDEIKEIASREPSEKQQKLNKEREAKSKALLLVIQSQECQNHIISILKHEIPHTNSEKYLNSDLKGRKQMQQKSPGPLVNEDQQTVAKLVNELSRTYFTDKPTNIQNYEHDILYPEAVIWAIKKKFNLNTTKAEARYLDAFKRTPEEILKQKCNEYLSENSLREDSSTGETSQIVENHEKEAMDVSQKTDESNQIIKNDDSEELPNIESVNSSLSMNTSEEKIDKNLTESAGNNDVDKASNKEENVNKHENNLQPENLSMEP